MSNCGRTGWPPHVRRSVDDELAELQHDKDQRAAVRASAERLGIGRRAFVWASVTRGERNAMECVIERADDVEPPAHLAAVGLIAETALRMLRDHGASPALLAAVVREGLER